MLNAGNTDFEKFVISGGGCAFDLDFHGTYSSGNHYIVMMLAADNLLTELPLTAGEQVKAYTIVSPVVIKGDGWDKVFYRPVYKAYITDDYNIQAVTLDLNISATASSVIIERN
jgi:hypothetical protein